MPDRIEALTQNLLFQKADPIPRYRILRDLKKLPDDDPELLEARRAIAGSRWYRQICDLLAEPLPEHLIRDDWRIRQTDGRHPARFQSVDDIVVRAKQIGLTANDPELQPLVEHLLDCIHGHITVHESMNPAIGRLLASGMLRQLVSNHPAQEPYAAALAGAVSDAYTSGTYQAERYRQTLCEALEVPDNLPVPPVESELVLIQLDGRLEHSVEALLTYDLLHHTRGIIGLNNRPMIHLPLKYPSVEACRYVLALEVLTHFDTVIDRLDFAREWLYECADEDGLWDISHECRDGIMLPLSESWRSPNHRRMDVSLQVMRVLQKLERSCLLRDIVCHPL